MSGSAKNMKTKSNFVLGTAEFIAFSLYRVLPKSLIASRSVLLESFFNNDATLSKSSSSSSSSSPQPRIAERESTSYFEQSPVGYVSKAIDFKSLKGKADYQKRLGDLYKKGSISKSDHSVDPWFTPVEVFKPIYSESIARFLIDTHLNKRNGSTTKELNIIEVGGGNGTNAQGILDFIKQNEPGLYENTKYTLIEVSPVLAKKQRQRLIDAGHVPEEEDILVNDNNITVINQDFLSTSVEVTDDCFVIAFEVLDNLPHDRILWKTNNTTHPSKGQWYEVAVKCSIQDDHSVSLSEVEIPLLSSDVKGSNDRMEEACIRRQRKIIEASTAYLSPLSPYYQRMEDEYRKQDLEELHGPFVKTFQRFFSFFGLSPEPQDSLVSPSISDVVSYSTAMDEDTNPLIYNDCQGIEGKRNNIEVFVPTGAYEFLQILCRQFPRHHLLTADFSFLPPPVFTKDSIRGVKQSNNDLKKEREIQSVHSVCGAPLISGRPKHNSNEPYSSKQTTDHEIYISEPLIGQCDIFFPTNFVRLHSMHQQLLSEYKKKRDSETISPLYLGRSKDFLEKWADTNMAQTRSGYNPLLEDFKNTMFYCSSFDDDDADDETSVTDHHKNE